MRLSAAILVLSAALAAPFASAQPTSRTFELSGGRFTEVPSSNPANLPKPDPTLKRVEVLLDRHDYPAAKSTVLRWLLENKNQPHYDQALYLMAQAMNGLNEPIKAFYYCDQLLDSYPGSEYFRPAVELQFTIGDELLKGRPAGKLLWIDLDGTDEGVEMMFRLQTRSPGSPLAERALRRTADFYYGDGQFDLAADAYGAYVKAYPRSADLPDVLVRQAFSNYAQFTGVKFDPTPLVNARAQMDDIINKYPKEAERVNMKSLVEAIDKTLARKLLVTADFYQRTGKPKARDVVLRVLTQQYPQTDEAQQAKRQLGEG